MSRISGNFGIKRDRIHNYKMDNVTSVESVKAVDPVSPVTAVENNTSLSNENFLLASDHFYDKLLKLKDEYKRFYHDEQELERAIEKLREGDDQLTSNMINLIDKYNHAITSLKTFDDAFNTNHGERINEILTRYQDELANIGMTIEENSLLSIDIKGFRENLSKSEYAVQFLFEPVKGLITNLYRGFRNIKVPLDNSFEKGYVDYLSVETSHITGSVLDKKS